MIASLSAGVGLALSHSLGGSRAQADLLPSQLEAADTALEAGEGEGGGVAEVRDVSEVQGGERGLSLSCDWRKVVQLEHCLGPVPAQPHTVPGPQPHRDLGAQPQCGAGESEAQLEIFINH